MQDQEIKTIDAAFYFDQRSKNPPIKIYWWQVDAVHSRIGSRLSLRWPRSMKNRGVGH